MLKPKQRKFLKGLAHHLNPVAFVGNNGVSIAVLKEIDRDLKDHELIKVRVSCDDQAGLIELRDQIMQDTNAELVQTIGHIVVLYRPAGEPKIKLPA